MALTIEDAGLQALADAATQLKIYTAEGGTLLLTFSTTDNVSSGTWTITSGSAATAAASGTPTYAEIQNSSNTVLLSGDVNSTGSPFITLGAVTSGNSYQISPNITISNA